RREVEAVGAGEAVVGAARTGGIAIVVVRNRGAVVQRHVEPVVRCGVAEARRARHEDARIAEDEATLRRARAAGREARAGNRERGLRPRAGADSVGLGVRAVEHAAEAVAAAADREVAFAVVAAMTVAAGLDVDQRAVELLLG